MTSLPKIDTQFMLEFLTELLNIPSPTGFTDAAIKYTEKTFGRFPEIKLSITRKGALVATLPGEKDDAPRGLTAHVSVWMKRPHQILKPKT
jgi:putative aminopeptidase FrvX